MKAFQQQSEELAKPSATILPPVFIHPTAQVDPTAKLGPNVSIGPRAVIGAGARIKEAIVLEDAEIKHDACVLYAIIGWSSRVGAWARVEGTPTPVRELSTSVVKNGVKVQSITILGKECAVADEVRVQNCVCLPYKELKRVSCCEVFHGMNSYANRCNRMCKTKSSCKRKSVGCVSRPQRIPRRAGSLAAIASFRSIQSTETQPRHLRRRDWPKCLLPTSRWCSLINHQNKTQKQ
jgi:carbonic anhydrase/acetyltransferase-like protein (isoleucine patch superfamily)